MKKIIFIATIGLALFCCKNEKKTEGKVEEKTELSNVETAKNEAISGEINWDEMPDLKDIGDFPFVTAPEGLKIFREKEDGLSDGFDFETMEIYTGGEITTVEGKLGILHFEGADDKDFNIEVFMLILTEWVPKNCIKEIFLKMKKQEKD